MTLTKTDIVNMLCSELGLPKKESATITESIFEIIKEELAKGKDVMISGFGKWSVRSKRARNGRNPKTGEEMIIEARTVVTFKPSPVLRDELDTEKCVLSDDKVVA